MFSIDFIGVGVPKAGTSWVAKCLSEHPEVYVPEMKELNFFTKVYPKLKDRSKSSVDLEYSRFFKMKSDFVGEYSPGYLYDINVPKLIKKYYPETKVIIILRNPVDRAYSEYYHYDLRYARTNKSFEEIAADKQSVYIKHSLYSEHVKRYTDDFDERHLLILKYEDISKNEIDFIRNIYRFIGVRNDNFIPESINTKINVAAVPRTEMIQKILTKMYDLAQILSKNNLGFINEISKILKFKTLIDYVYAQLNIKATKKRGLNVETSRHIFRLFEKDIEELEKLTGLDFTEWRVI